MPCNPSNTWTSDALQRGDIDAIRKRAIDDPAYLHEQDYVGQTPLLTAIAFGRLELVRLLLEQGADPNVPVNDGYTCLLTAVESDTEESSPIVAELIRAGADVHGIGTNGWTPLHMAAARGQAEKARLLIDAGASVDQRKEIDAGETPLMEAAFLGQPSTVRLLLEHGADPALRDTIRQWTPLEIAENAAKGPDPDVIDVLRNENIPADADELFGDMDLPAEQLEMLKQTLKDFDPVQSYIQNSNRIVREGNHAEVVRILKEQTR